MDVERRAAARDAQRAKVSAIRVAFSASRWASAASPLVSAPVIFARR